MLTKNWWKKIVVIVIGSMIAAYGITLALYAGFGGATLAVLWQGLSETFHMSIGMASFMVALGMILFVVIYDRSQIHIGTVLYQIVYSACVDLFANCHIYSRYVWVNFLIMLLGVILFAVGTGLYASASLGRGSYEAVTFALAEKNNWQVKIVRMILDIVMVVVGVLLGGKFGICTIVTVIISGPVIQLVNVRSKQLFKM
ncbi:MAG: YitT family protein [Lachnospiraceae bacterium]|nr:YitT family protein [Lachnospiraceae bacterium]